MDRLLVVAVHHAGAFAQDLNRASSRAACTRMLASRMVRADPAIFPLAIFLMKRGTSMCVGHAVAQGASKQKRQRLASGIAACRSRAGCRSPKRAAVSADFWRLLHKGCLAAHSSNSSVPASLWGCRKPALITSHGSQAAGYRGARSALKRNSRELRPRCFSRATPPLRDPTSAS